MADFPKPTTAQHGLLNEYSCGCQVRRDGSGGHFIHMCPLHAAARELLIQLKETAFSFHVEAEHKAAFSACTNTYCANACRQFNEHAAAREAIKQAGGV